MKIDKAAAWAWRMLLVLSLFLLAGQTKAIADDEIMAPKGFVLQSLDPTDGLIARPKNWFYQSHGTASGWLWIISAEDPTKGSYETGLRIQMLVGIQKGTGLTTEAFARNYLNQKRQEGQILKDCPDSDVGQFQRHCIESIEADSQPGHQGEKLHILTTVSWGKSMDMVVVSIFGAPDRNWDQVAPIADVMAKYRLLGPNFGKPKS